MKGELNSIRNLREILTQSRLFLVYQAPVESRLRYENLIGGHLPEKTLPLAGDLYQGILPHWIILYLGSGTLWMMKRWEIHHIWSGHYGTQNSEENVFRKS